MTRTVRFARTPSAVLAVVMLVVAVASCGGDHERAADSDLSVEEAVARTNRGSSQGRVPQFLVECPFSHFAPDDPIVWPDQPGRSHNHTFIGNNSADASSTVESLSKGDTNCQLKQDKASYWAPTLYDHDEPVAPYKADAYYRPGPLVDPTSIEPYPYGLKMIAGDHTKPEQPLEVARWSCGTGSPRQTTAPECDGKVTLRLEVIFPDCWNGKDLDSADHRSHMAVSSEGECPATHPVPVPQLMLAYSYPIRGPGHDLKLASGETGTAHADFFNAWEPEALQREIESCLHREVVCGVASNRPPPEGLIIDANR
ncbi:MAG: DUF1996 domain-containing protein [Microthrixaceae bacterium]|nr:DUF1996 domain-containing protein [Microthrixaceae bacterium]